MRILLPAERKLGTETITIVFGHLEPVSHRFIFSLGLRSDCRYVKSTWAEVASLLGWPVGVSQPLFALAGCAFFVFGARVLLPSSAQLIINSSTRSLVPALSAIVLLQTGASKRLIELATRRQA